MRAEEPEGDILAATDLIAEASADILVLSGIDYDHGLAALDGLRGLVRARGLDYPHSFALQPNAGIATGLDLDGNGWTGDARDAQGYGEFAGQGGLAVLSRYPVTGWESFSDFLWRDLPGTLMAEDDPGAPVQRLSSNGHWSVEVTPPGADPVTLLVFHATPPVFDGPEDRNGRRNHDEAAFWLHWMAGTLSGDPPKHRFLVLGDANLDPVDGDGRSDAISALLTHPMLQDPEPRAPEGADFAKAEGGANRTHRGDPTLDTANWRDGPEDPGNLRVDYVLPSRDWSVAGSGILWGSAERGADVRPRHGLVWADLVMDR